eukprot:GEMP01051211.1.p1 GENE.GEMP01051211.1~~GEMP01051211.1.p1  ORF type:complete len:195 (+),score=24.21 GEMP01051211.1:196-780(+)
MCTRSGTTTKCTHWNDSAMRSSARSASLTLPMYTGRPSGHKLRCKQREWAQEWTLPDSRMALNFARRCRISCWYSSRCHPLGLRYCQPPKPLSSTLPLTRHGNSVLRQWENLAPEEREAVWLDPSSHWYNSPCGSSTVATSSSRRVSSHLSRSNSDMVGTQKISSSVASLEGEYEAGSDEEAAVLPPVSVASDV